MKILTIIGARPQFIKASMVSKAIAKQANLQEIIIHTGQHFDTNMSDIFFKQLGIPKPNYQLDINNGFHGEMTGRMMAEIERVILEEKPDRVLVYGDTNSTLAGALAGIKLHVPIAHVEAGLRSYNMQMPEEINRILTDQVSDILFCPSQTAVDNLYREGFENKPVKILNIGDVMQDSALFFVECAVAPIGISLPNDYVLATIHRAENTDDYSNLANIVAALNEIHQTLRHVVVPLHPRTREAIVNAKLELDVQVIEPVGYLEMIWLLKHSGIVLTDSGGVQKEAFFFGKACVTLRDETEWVELVDIGANILVGADKTAISEAVHKNIDRVIEAGSQIYGGGQSAEKIVKHLVGSVNL